MSELLTKGTDEREFKDSKLGRIPKNWEITSLNQNLELLTDFEANGSFADVKSNVRVFNEPNYAWYVRATDLEKKTPLSNVKYVDKETYEFLRKTTLIDKEVLIAKRGEIGKVYFFRGAGVPATAAPNTYVLRLKKSLDPFYLYCYLTSPFGNQRLKRINASTTIGALYKDDVKKFKLPLPPLPEQKKIASILTSVDEVIDNTQKQIDKLQDLKKAIMNELLTKGIGHTEFKDSELGRIPKSWGVVSLDKVCKVRQGLQIPIRDRFKGAATGRYPYLTVSWINSKFDIDKAEFIANPSDSVVLKSNEFVVGRTGAVGQIFDGLECVFHNNFFAVSLLTDSVEKEFLKHFLKWHTTQDLLLKLAGSTTIPDLNHGDFYSINVGLPPVEEQCRVVSQVNSIDTTLREIRLKLNALMSLKKSLMQDLLTGKVRVTVN